MEKRFSIKVISDSCGIKAHTIRVWEQRYGVFSPVRSDSGQRLYDEDDMKKAKFLARLVEKGHAISTLANYSLEDLEGMVETHVEETSSNNLIIQKARTEKLLKHLLDYKNDLVADELQHLRSTLSAKEFIFNIVLPTMREIGILTMKGKYTVTQEHIISTIIRDQLSQLYLPNIGDRSQQVALATPDGNLHELAIIIADILCRINRVPTRYLGAAHPAECLSEALNALGCPNLILGVLSSDQWDYQRDIGNYLSKLDAKLTEEITVVLGAGSPLDLPEFKNIKEVHFVESFENLDDYLRRLI